MKSAQDMLNELSSVFMVDPLVRYLGVSNGDLYKMAYNIDPVSDDIADRARRLYNCLENLGTKVALHYLQIRSEVNEENVA